MVVVDNTIHGDIADDPNPRSDGWGEEDEELEVMLELVVEVEMKREVKKRERIVKERIYIGFDFCKGGANK